MTLEGIILSANKQVTKDHSLIFMKYPKEWNQLTEKQVSTFLGLKIL
jgi:hypothetical protein